MKLMMTIGLFLVLLYSCVSKEVNERPDSALEEQKEMEEPLVLIPEEVFIDSTVRANLAEVGLVNIKDVNPNILVDVRYATDNNFMGFQLYDSINHIYLQATVADRLSKVQDYLDSIRPGYRLKIFDGVRPLNVQQEMWDALDTVPPLNRGKFVSNPAFGSVHNYGAAVDLTICDENQHPLDMGAGYDDFRKIAFPSLEAHFLKTGELTKEQYQNRLLLRKVMRSQQFYNIPSEWWHFNAHSRGTAEAKFPQLLTESGDSRRTKFSAILNQSDSLVSPETRDTIAP